MEKEKEISEKNTNDVILPWWMAIFYFLGIAAFIKYLCSDNNEDKKLEELKKVNQNLENMKNDFDDAKLRLINRIDFLNRNRTM